MVAANPPISEQVSQLNWARYLSIGVQVSDHEARACRASAKTAVALAGPNRRQDLALDKWLPVLSRLLALIVDAKLLLAKAVGRKGYAIYVMNLFIVKPRQLLSQNTHTHDKCVCGLGVLLAKAICQYELALGAVLNLNLPWK